MGGMGSVTDVDWQPTQERLAVSCVQLVLHPLARRVTKCRRCHGPVHEGLTSSQHTQSFFY